MVRSFSLATAAALLAAALLASGCAAVDLDGNWSGQWHSSIFTGAFSMHLEQQGQDFSGNFEIGGTWCVGSGTIDGSLDNRKLTAVMSAGAGDKVALDGTVGPGGDDISGSFNVAGGACTDSVGRFDLTRD